MIRRYTHPDMGAIWSDQRRYETWLAVELAATDALAGAGIVPVEEARELRAVKRLLWALFILLALYFLSQFGRKRAPEPPPGLPDEPLTSPEARPGGRASSRKRGSTSFCTTALM